MPRFDLMYYIVAQTVHGDNCGTDALKYRFMYRIISPNQEGYPNEKTYRQVVSVLFLAHDNGDAASLHLFQPLSPRKTT